MVISGLQPGVADVVIPPTSTRPARRLPDPEAAGGERAPALLRTRPRF
jgi:hypothetical protein